MSYDHKYRKRGIISDDSQGSLYSFLAMNVILKRDLTHSGHNDKNSYDFFDYYCDSNSTLVCIRITWDTCLAAFSWV